MPTIYARSLWIKESPNKKKESCVAISIWGNEIGTYCYWKLISMYQLAETFFLAESKEAKHKLVYSLYAGDISLRRDWINRCLKTGSCLTVSDQYKEYSKKSPSRAESICGGSYLRTLKAGNLSTEHRSKFHFGLLSTIFGSF